MPTNVTPSPTDTTWLADAPAGADMSFDELFGSNPEQTHVATAIPETQTTTTSADPAGATASSETPRPPETTLDWQPIKASTGTVYNTYEDTVKGIEQKDTLIAQLRAKLQEVTGQDPVKKSSQQQPTQSTPQQGGYTYLGNPQKYAADLAEAAKRGDAHRYMDIQVQLQDERTAQTLAPYQPILQELTRTTAQRKVKEAVKEFDQFIGSDNYSQTLEANPALKNAINAAEHDVRYASQLDELYRLAHDSFVARVQLPKLIAEAQQTAASPATASPARPVVTQSTLTPTAPTTAQSDSELMRTAQGRKELIERLKAQGFDNMRF